MSSAIAGTALPALAHADAGTLYVNNNATAHCSDAGTGTEQQPFCTIQAAADAAQPGQTVQIAMNGSYPEQVTLKHSGSQGSPITFKGTTYYGTPTNLVGADPSSATAQSMPHAFVLNGVHDITVTGLYLQAPQEAVLVQDSDRIVLDGNTVDGAGQPGVVNGTPNFPNPASAIRLTGKTTNTTVSRNLVEHSGAAGVQVDAGVSGAIVTTNQLDNNKGGGVVVTGASGTAVTSNTITQNCQTGVTVAGAASATTVENNIISSNVASRFCQPQAGQADLSVSADSTGGTKADYNTVFPWTGRAGYSWGGTPYTAATDFQATGQGAHDNSVNPQFGPAGERAWAPAAQVGVTDAADANAPGELDTDINGNARVDDPQIANTGTGVGYYDRGAVELQDPIAASLWVRSNITPGHPMQVRAQNAVTPGWSLASSTLDFGDGSAPVTSVASGTVNHDYLAGGTYTVTLTVTSSSGVVRKSTGSINVNPVGALFAQLSWSQPDKLVSRTVFSDNYTSSPWTVTGYSLDFGDGTPPVVGQGSTLPSNVAHDYAQPGYYTVHYTVTDDHGRSSTPTYNVAVAGAMTGTPFSGYLGGPATHVGLFDNGTFLTSFDNLTKPASQYTYFGVAGDIPITGMWEIGRSGQVGVYRPSIASFALRMNDGSVTVVPFGQPGDLPVPGNWDRNGHDQLAIYRPSTGTLAVRHDDGTVSTLSFGNPGDLPVVGDWDGVGHAQFGIFRPGANPGDANTFALRHDDGSVSVASYGEKGDLPVVGDWQATGRLPGQPGRTTYGIFRPSSRTFALCNAYVGQPDSVFQLLSSYNN